MRIELGSPYASASRSSLDLILADPAFLYPHRGQDISDCVEQLAIPFSNFQPTTQPTKIMSYMNFRELCQSPRSCKSL